MEEHNWEEGIECMSGYSNLNRVVMKDHTMNMTSERRPKEG